MRVQIASKARQREHRRQKYDHRVAFELTQNVYVPRSAASESASE